MLARCLEALKYQQCDGFAYSLVVVDNDRSRSAERVVRDWRHSSHVDLHYDVEPVQNISLARNRAISISEGGLIAFIDDDEYPHPAWLSEFVNAYTRYSADVVLGPVTPVFDGAPPGWLVKSGLSERGTFRTGTRLRDTRHMSTANVLLKRSVLDGEAVPFDPQMGRSGGEDTDLFNRLLQRGALFVWCQEALVYEQIPAERQTRRYHIRRAFIRGVNTARRQPFLSVGTIKSIVAVMAYTVSLPLLLVGGQHLFMKYFVKDCDHLAKLLAHLGVKLVRARAD